MRKRKTVTREASDDDGRPDSGIELLLLFVTPS